MRTAVPSHTRVSYNNDKRMKDEAFKSGIGTVLKSQNTSEAVREAKRERSWASL